MIAPFDNLGLWNSFILAPIAGYTDSPFRRICISHGAGLVVTELISAEGILRNNRASHEMLNFDDSERPIAIQIFGKDPRVMGEAASIVQERKPDIIDINMGCPARKVVSSGSGSALLKDPRLMRQIIDAVVSSVDIPVSVKIRVGWDSIGPLGDYVQAIEDGGASFMTVHGRTRNQMYAGRADWNAIARIAGISVIPVIGNGDIITREQGSELQKQTGCAAVMIGRGALGNPWIFSGKIPSSRELFQQIAEHMALMDDLCGEYGVIMMRKHVVRYIHNRPGASKVRARVMGCMKSGEVMEILGDFLG